MESRTSPHLSAWRWDARLACTLAALLAWSVTLTGEAVRVQYREGLVHGFLELRDSGGKELASGDLLQVPHGSQISSELVFRFRDGSRHEETTVFSQRGHFRLVRHRLVQRGPAFPRSIDMAIDGTSGRVTVRSSAEGGKKEERFDEHLDVPNDLANGLVPILLKNVRPDAPPRSFSLVVATPRPRVVELRLSSAGREPFRTGSMRRQATHFVLKVEIGGVTGLLAPLVGKQPPDSHVWILGGPAPAFVRSQQPFYEGGPLWEIALTSPRWPTGRDER